MDFLKLGGNYYQTCTRQIHYQGITLIDFSHGDKTGIWAKGELNRLSRQTGTFIPMPLEQSTTVLSHSAPKLGAC
jgi:hypothetical protein